MPKKLLGIREFARRLDCSPSYICKLIDYGVIKKTASGKLDPVECVKRMRNYRDPGRESALNLSGRCWDCEKAQNSLEIGAMYCRVCDKKEKYYGAL